MIPPPNAHLDTSRKRLNTSRKRLDNLQNAQVRAVTIRERLPA
jgi:hypothetical protein